MKKGDFVYFFVPQKSALMVFVGTLLIIENYFCEIPHPIRSCKQYNFWDMNPVYYFNSNVERFYRGEMK